MFERNSAVSRMHEEAEYSGDTKENPKKITQKPWKRLEKLRLLSPAGPPARQHSEKDGASTRYAVTSPHAHNRRT